MKKKKKKKKKEIKGRKGEKEKSRKEGGGWYSSSLRVLQKKCVQFNNVFVAKYRGLKVHDIILTFKGKTQQNDSHGNTLYALNSSGNIICMISWTLSPLYFATKTFLNWTHFF